MLTAQDSCRHCFPESLLENRFPINGQEKSVTEEYIAMARITPSQ